MSIAPTRPDTSNDPRSQTPTRPAVIAQSTTARPTIWRALRWLLQHVTLLAAVLIFITPLYAMLVSSLQDAISFRGESWAIPSSITLDNYITAWTTLGFRHMVGNSAILALLSASLTTLLGSAAAYGLIGIRRNLRAFILITLVIMIGVPPIISVLPLYFVAADLGLLNTYSVGIGTEVGLMLPFSVFLLYSYMRDLPREQFEAATVDGAGLVGRYWHVALPLSYPALLVNWILCAVFAWNDLVVPLVLWQSEQLETLMVGLSSLGPGRTGMRAVPLLMAGVTITILPLLLLFALVRRVLINGITEGGGR